MIYIFKVLIFLHFCLGVFHADICLRYFVLLMKKYNFCANLKIKAVVTMSLPHTRKMCKFIVTVDVPMLYVSIFTLQMEILTSLFFHYIKNKTYYTIGEIVFVTNFLCL